MKIQARKVYENTVVHDDWCDRPQGGLCTCDPIEIVTEV